MSELDLPKKKQSKQGKRKAWQRLLVYVVLLILALIVGGFFAFAYNVDHRARPVLVPKADGIVVWTGKGGGRLSAGADLLAGGHGERLLISGVNESNARDDILALLKLDPKLSACCVDLDYAARDTIGNARETSNWSDALGYEHIILVTSAYHMPRAEVEISAVRGRIHITPYPVRADENVKWWKDESKFRRLTQEYGKLLIAYFRRMGSGSRRGGPRLETLPVQVESTPDNVNQTETSP